MSAARNPLRDTVAFAGAATTGFLPRNSGRSTTSLAAQASIDVLRQCGLGPADVDGICGSIPSAPVLQATLGIPEVTWFANPAIPIVNQVAAAVTAVHAGLCEVVLVYHTAYRAPWNTMSSLKDPFRRSAGTAGAAPAPESVSGSVGYTAWASRYIHEFKVPKEHFGYIALNDRAGAAANPAAALREPITMDDYLAARMIRWPLNLLDMDVPVDGADAFVVTTAERARDMPLPPVLVDAVAFGAAGHNDEEQTDSLRRHGQQVTVAALRARSSFWIDDIDVYFPYDGFSFIALNWFENVGWCGPGEAGSFLELHRDDTTGRILLDGRIPVNPHGGALSEGGTQGSGHLREAVHQLQGLAGARQVPDARRALLTVGGFFFNAQAMTLRRD